MTRIPPYLVPGDTIGMMCPAGYMPYEKIETCIHTLKQWGYQVKEGKTLGGNSLNYFSGTDEERLAELQEMLDDPEIKAILFARGGYGMSRIVDRIDFSRYKKAPKWIIGYSDITVLHSHISRRHNIATIHGPMAGAFNDGGFENQYVQSLRKALEGQKATYVCTRHPYSRNGEASGKLVGGNLALLAHLCGTKSEIKTRGKILFLEDVGEYLYNIDRMLVQLKRSGRLKSLAGLIFGGFSECRDTERPFGMPLDDILRRIVDEYDYPVAFGFPVSHSKENYALKIGVQYNLRITDTKIVLEE